MPATIRISSTAHRSLAKMAEQTNTSLQEMLDRAVENERRRLLLERTNLALFETSPEQKSLESLASRAAAIGCYSKRRDL